MAKKVCFFLAVMLPHREEEEKDHKSTYPKYVCTQTLFIQKSHIPEQYCV